MPVKLWGYRHSVYAWIARLALHEKGVAYTWSEVDPFADRVPADYLALHPFGRVPTLIDGDFVVYETSAITQYIDEAFEGPRLQPLAPAQRARIRQIVSVIDSYAYWPLVRQVFSHGVFRPRLGQLCDHAEYRRGLEAAPRVLHALDQLAQGGSYLIADGLSLADVHLAPMIAYFTEAPDGRAFMAQHERLSAWWSAMSLRPALVATRPSWSAP